MELTRDNYYTPEADREFMSCSQYQGWCECEAKQYAKLNGYWVDEPKEAFIVGNYFHTYFEGPEAHAQFKREHLEDIYKTRIDKKTGETIITGMYAAYEQVEKMIKVAERDELIQSLIAWPGENEVIMSGVLFGVPWRIRIDKYCPDMRVIIDWKTCANIQELRWNTSLKAYETFIDTYGYMMRAAVYSEIEKQYAGSNSDPHFIIVAISKQDYPDKEVLELNHRQRYDYELMQIKDRLPYIVRVKNGSVKPTRCGACDYCRATKKLFEIKPYYKLMPEFKGAREEDYAEGTMLADPQAQSILEPVSPVQKADTLEKV